jgi:hypothetical protein
MAIFKIIASAGVCAYDARKIEIKRMPFQFAVKAAHGNKPCP